VDLASGPAPNVRTSACTSGLTPAPIDASIWEGLEIGALRVAPINPAVSGCERLAPATSAIELLTRDTVRD